MTLFRILVPLHLDMSKMPNLFFKGVWIIFFKSHILNFSYLWDTTDVLWSHLKKVGVWRRSDLWCWSIYAWSKNTALDVHNIVRTQSWSFSVLLSAALRNFVLVICHFRFITFICFILYYSKRRSRCRLWFLTFPSGGENVFILKKKKHFCLFCNRTMMVSFQVNCYCELNTAVPFSKNSHFTFFTSTVDCVFSPRSRLTAAYSYYYSQRMCLELWVCKVSEKGQKMLMPGVL